MLFLTGVIILSSILVSKVPEPLPVYGDKSNEKEKIGVVYLAHKLDLGAYLMLLPLYGLQIWALLHFGKRMKRVEEIIETHSQSTAEPVRGVDD